MTGTTFIGATQWPYMAGNQEVVVLPDAEKVLRAAGWVHRTDPLRDQLAHTAAPIVPVAGDEEFGPEECNGSNRCEASKHVHGCYSDYGACDEPYEHPASIYPLGKIKDKR